MLNGLFKKPKIKLEEYKLPPIDGRPTVPDNTCTVCPACRRLVVTVDLEESLYICPACSHYLRVPARQRMEQTVDKGTFSELFANITSQNPLTFPQYAQRLEKAKRDSGEEESVICGTGQIGGLSCALFAMDPRFLMGSMGAATGEKITCLFEYAAEHNLPVVGCILSGGARMQEGIFSLMQMAKVSGAVKRHSDKGLLYVALLADPTTGGVTASFAMQADIILAEPGALIGFAGPRVIEQTIRKKLPPGFQRAEFLVEKGFVDRIVPRAEQRSLFAKLLLFHKR
ncbi:MAG TPA: acetyl-CoA carboxylase, carboxyltransferase subunit beta [Clostridiales bacterium]|nr:acetyl-CoA carboxylase, carboxyltransferase subunit beta [Clostridiales bacterium]